MHERYWLKFNPSVPFVAPLLRPLCCCCVPLLEMAWLPVAAKIKMEKNGMTRSMDQVSRATISPIRRTASRWSRTTTALSNVYLKNLQARAQRMAFPLARIAKNGRRKFWKTAGSNARKKANEAGLSWLLKYLRLFGFSALWWCSL